MLYLIYDGSFQGFLTAIYEAFYSEKSPEQIISEDKFTNNLFSTTKKIETDEEKADKVYDAIKNKISSYTLRTVYYCYLSELEEIEINLFKYLKLGFKEGGRVNKFHSNDTVKKIISARKKVSREAHRMKGLLRFRTLKNGVYYGPMEPDYNIIEILARHFAKRLSDQDWIIHDISREWAAIYNQHEWALTPLTETDIELSDKEEAYQDLWQEFFDSIAIENRKNQKLQQQNMPKKYWKHLVEKNN